VPVRQAAYGDEAALRDLRLQAMQDAPDAFGSTYEREAARTESDWQRWFSPGVTFIFESADDGPIGLVAGVRDDGEPNVAHLMALWVHPSRRGQGAGDALVSAVLSWAESQQLDTIRLHVMESNAAARRLYERLGFRVTGNTTSRDRDGLAELEMLRP
jgi:ribosomal protein S18 acetylase RimI-like enzyme